MSKKNKENTINFVLITIFIGFVIGNLFNLIVLNQNNNCSGIGGFIYKEIEWQQQTINVIKENCESGMWIDDYTYKNYYVLACSKKKKCFFDGYCKQDGFWESPIKTPKED